MGPVLAGTRAGGVPTASSAPGFSRNSGQVSSWVSARSTPRSGCLHWHPPPRRSDREGFNDTCSQNCDDQPKEWALSYFSIKINCHFRVKKYVDLFVQFSLPMKNEKPQNFSFECFATLFYIHSFSFFPYLHANTSSPWA